MSGQARPQHKPCQASPAQQPCSGWQGSWRRRKSRTGGDAKSSSSPESTSDEVRRGPDAPNAASYSSSAAHFQQEREASQPGAVTRARSPAQQQQEGAATPASETPTDSLDARILALALPAVVALAADPLLSLVDTSFVGHLGPNALASLGVNTGLFSFAFVVFNFLATATTPLLAASLASGDREQAGRLTTQAWLLSVVLGVCVTVGLLWGAEPVLAFLGAGPETGEMHDLALVYLQYRAVAAPAVLLMTVGQGVFRGLQDMRTPLAVTLGANVVNLGLDCALIWGAGWGVGGAAVATTIAEWGAAAAYGALIWKRREELGLSPMPVLDLRALPTQLAPFLRAGGAVLARTMLLLGTKTLASATATRLGPVPIASHQVLSQLWLLSSLIIDSLAVSGQTLVAVELAAGDAAGARRIADRLMQFGVGLGLLLVVVYSLGAPLLPALFTDDEAVTAEVTRLLPLAVGMLPVNAVVYVLDGVLVGASDFKFLAGAMVLSAACAVGVLLQVEPSGLGLTGVWASLGALMALRLATLMWRYNSAGSPVPPLPPAAPAAAPASAASPRLPSQAGADLGARAGTPGGPVAPGCKSSAGGWPVGALDEAVSDSSPAVASGCACVPAVACNCASSQQLLQPRSSVKARRASSAGARAGPQVNRGAGGGGRDRARKARQQQLQGQLQGQEEMVGAKAAGRAAQGAGRLGSSRAVKS